MTKRNSTVSDISSTKVLADNLARILAALPDEGERASMVTDAMRSMHIADARYALQSATLNDNVNYASNQLSTAQGAEVETLRKKIKQFQKTLALSGKRRDSEAQSYKELLGKFEKDLEKLGFLNLQTEEYSKEEIDSRIKGAKLIQKSSNDLEPFR